MNTTTIPSSISGAENSTLRRLEATVELRTGQKAADLRNQTLRQLRTATESKRNQPLRFAPRFPLIGRGNVMRDKLINHQQVEDLLDKLLR